MHKPKQNFMKTIIAIVSAENVRTLSACVDSYNGSTTGVIYFNALDNRLTVEKLGENLSEETQKELLRAFLNGYGYECKFE